MRGLPNSRVHGPAGIKSLLMLMVIATLLSHACFGESPPVSLETGPALSATVSADGSTIAVCLLEQTTREDVGPGMIKVFDVASRQLKAVLKPASPYPVIWQAVFFPDSRKLATSGYDGVVRFWNLTTKRETGKIVWRENMASRMAVSPDGQLLAMLGVAGGLRVHDVQHDRDVFSLPQHQGSAIVFSEDCRYLAADSEKHIAVWSTKTWKMRRQLSGISLVGCAFLGRREELLLLVCGKGNVEELVRWNFAGNTRKTVLSIPYKVSKNPGIENTGNVFSVMFSGDGGLMATANLVSDKKARLRIWRTDDGLALLDRVMPEEQIGQVIAFSENNKTLITATRQKVWLWNAWREDGNERGQRARKEGRIKSWGGPDSLLPGCRRHKVTPRRRPSARKRPSNDNPGGSASLSASSRP